MKQTSASPNLQTGIRENVSPRQGFNDGINIVSIRAMRSDNTVNDVQKIYTACADQKLLDDLAHIRKLFAAINK